MSGLPVTAGQERGDLNVVRIGRLPKNDIVVDDLAVARYHAELRRSQSGRYEIIDLASHNGTYVNGTRVNKALLAEGDIVTFGHTTFKVVNGELREHNDEGNDTPET
jgi:pSer/pThr/pTyr-binding forkhead associated (FHA) protein